MGCGLALLTSIAAIVAVGYVTWSRDTCAVYVGRLFAANITLEGWGANEHCSQLVDSSANRLFV